MEAQQTARPSRPTPPSQTLSWDWSGDLKALESAMHDVESQGSWDWRRDLAELEGHLDQLAAKLGRTG